MARTRPTMVGRRATVEQAKLTGRLQSLDAFWSLFESDALREAAQTVLKSWQAAGHRKRLGPNHVVLEASGPSTSGIRTVIAIYADGRVFVPFSSYEGQNSGIPIASLTTEAFRSSANQLFGFNGSDRQARTTPGWLTPTTADDLIKFCEQVAAAYASAAE